jgi:hypothetical protein
MILGIVGFIGAGKGTVGDLLDQRGFKKDSFAAPLKDAVSCIFNWPREMLEGDTEVSRNWREIPDSFWSEKFGKSFSPRLALQLMGTEAGRNVFHKDIWVISMFNRAKNRNIVITDVRFKNEIEYIQKNGGHVVRIKRGPEPFWYNKALNCNRGLDNEMLKMNIHSSEWDWIGCDFDYVIDNDGDLQDLDNKIDLMLKHFRG